LSPEQASRWRLFLDQNIPHPVTGILRDRLADGTVIDHVLDVGLTGAADQALFEWAQLHRRMIVTYDEDFADQRLFPVGNHLGVIRLRVEPTTIEVTAESLTSVLTTFAPEDFAGKLVIVDSIRVRILG